MKVVLHHASRVTSRSSPAVVNVMPTPTTVVCTTTSGGASDSSGAAESGSGGMFGGRDLGEVAGTDPRSLVVQAYLTLLHVDYCGIFTEQDAITQGCGDSLPLLAVWEEGVNETEEPKLFAGTYSAMEYLARVVFVGRDSDETAFAQQMADLYSVLSILDGKLYPALNYILWHDEATYNHVTRTTFCQSMPFLLRHLVPPFRKRTSLTQFVSTPQAQDRISECLTSLTTLLGEKQFFGGSSPSAIDAAVFAYIFVLYGTPFPFAGIRTVLGNHMPLVQLANTMHSLLFA
ncbi:mitochondrial sorting and assembly machinery 37 kDa subunit [Pelomyxa schiedti]|nr:mitochondrial sorting and assembly machinery 37 kDa subunit [Pelomyxa schiedti]